MELKDIVHLPDDVLNIIFLYLTNPLTKALKSKQKAIHFLEDDKEEEDRHGYVLYKSIYQVKEVVMKGFWDDLFKCDYKQRDFIQDTYSPYEFDRYDRMYHHNERLPWINRLQRLKFKTNKDLKQIITNNKIPNRSKATTKEKMIQLIIIYK